MANIKTIEEINARRKLIKPAGAYGVPFLDNFLGGIMPEDLVILAAETGAGKTQMAFDIAFKNAAKKVLLLALEADVDEPENRRYFSIIANLYFRDKSEYKKKQYVDPRNFMLNRLDLSKYEAEANAIFNAAPRPIIVLREDKFDASDIKRAVLENLEGLSLLVLDHLDYLDLDHDRSENIQVSEIMKDLRQINQQFHVPIVAVSHLRKGARKTLMPTLDELMGSSNKAKQAKTVIAFAKVKDAQYIPGEFPTYISILKSRYGLPGNILAECTFSSELGKYEADYKLLKYNQFDDTVTQMLEAEYPHWAKERF